MRTRKRTTGWTARLFTAWAVFVGGAAMGADDATPSGDGLRIMSTRGFARTGALSENAGREAAVAFRFELPYGLAPGWRLPYLGFSDGAANDPRRIELRGVAVAVEDPADPESGDGNGAPARFRIAFDGRPTATVDAHRVVESDPVDRAVRPGGTVTVTTWYRNPAPGGPLPFLNWGFVSTRGDMDGYQCADAGTMTDAVLDDPAALAWRPTVIKPLNAGQPQLIRSYQPMFIAGRPHPSHTGPTPAPIFLGDSINIANGDFNRAFPEDRFAARGWNGRYGADRMPYLVYGQGGSNGAGFFDRQDGELFVHLFGDAEGRGGKGTHLVDAYGINGLRDRNPGKSWRNIWDDRVRRATVAVRLGLPYIHTTLTPMTAGQLVIHQTLPDRDPAHVFAAFTADWLTFNDQVRAQSGTIPGCAGFIDWSPAVAAAPDRNEWIAGMGPDGIHPNIQGHQRMADSIPVDLFTKPSAAASARP